MARNPAESVSMPVEALHTLALSAAAIGLLAGIVARDAVWVNLSVSLILLLPPLRLATTVVSQARARRYLIAFTGVVVLAFLLLSRRIS